MKVWLDTDLGDDIDDTLVVEALLKHPSIELLGISTVFKNSPLRALMAKHMASMSGKPSLPIFAGASRPLKGLTPVRPHEIFSQWGEELGMVPPSLKEEAKSQKASLEMLETLKNNPGSVVLSIGPLTNIALAQRLDDEAVLKEHPIFFMGGDYKREIPEWNLECDVLAFSELLSSNLSLYAIGLEETEKTLLNSEEEEQLMHIGSMAISEYRKECITRFKRATHWSVTPHDFLALYALENKDKLVWKKCDVDILFKKEERVRGYLRVKKGTKINYLDHFSRTDFLTYFYQSLNS